VAFSRVTFNFLPFELYLVGLNNILSAVLSKTVCGLDLGPRFVYVEVIHALFCVCCGFGVASDAGCLLYWAFIES